MTSPQADSSYFAAFLDLRGKRGLVAGGGAVAAPKTETLLRSGVRVTVIAPELCSRLAELVVLGGSCPSAQCMVRSGDHAVFDWLLRLQAAIADNLTGRLWLTPASDSRLM